MTKVSIFKRSLSLVLTLMMILSMLPLGVTTFAAESDPIESVTNNPEGEPSNQISEEGEFVAKIGDVGYETLSAAITAAQAGDTIELLSDVTVNGKITISKNITVEGNNHKIIANHTNFILETSSDCTFQNVTLDTNNKSKGVKIASGNVVFDNLTIPNSNKSDAITVQGTLTLKTYFKAISTYSLIDARYGVVNAEPGTVFDMTKFNGNVSPSKSDLTKAVGIDGKPYFVGFSSTGYLTSITSSTINDITLINGITLLEDVTLNQNVTVSGKRTINLDGHTLTVPDGKAININKGQLVVNNGKIDGSVVMNDVGDSVVAPKNNVTVSVTEALAAKGYVAVYEEGNGYYCVDLPLPDAIITDIKDDLTAEDPELTFALNFAFPDNLTQAYIDELFAVYGDWYTDYVLTISGLSEESVTFNANNEEADGYLAGQYDGWSEYWVVVPFEDVTMQNGESLLIMETAGEMLGQSGLRMTLAEIAEIVTNFNCGVYFTPEFLAANPNLKVTLELRVFAEEDKHGFDYVIPVATNKFENNYSAPVATVNGVAYATLEEALAAAQDGDTITLLKDVAPTAAITIEKDITVDLNGKTWTLPVLSNYAVVIKDTLTIEGNGKVVNGDLGFGLSTTCTGGLYINGGNFESKGEYSYLIGAFAGEVVINDGNFDVAYSAVNSFEGYNATVSIKGGNFVNSSEWAAYFTAMGDNVAISGGTFNVEIVEDYIADGYKVKKDGDVYTVVPNMIFEIHLTDANGNAHWLSPLRSNNINSVLKTAKVWYESLQGTYDFTLVILEDCSVKETVLADFPLTIDLNGHTINGINDVYPVIRVQDNAEVTIKNGTVKNDDYVFVLGSKDGATAGYLTIESGTYIGETTVASVTNGTLTINGGSFSLIDTNTYDYAYLLNCIDANYNNGTAKIIVNGGAFENFNPANNSAEGANTSFVADGYKAEKDGDVYTVVPNMIFEVHLTDANGNAHWLSPLRSNNINSALKTAKVWYESLQGTYDFTLVILEDCSVKETILVDFPLTIDLNGHTLTVADGKAININKGQLVVNNGKIVGSVVMNDVGDSVVAPKNNVTVSVTADLAAKGYVAVYEDENGYYCVDLPLPDAIITDIKDDLTAEDPELTFALNFAFPDNLTQAYIDELFAVYGDWYTDYVLTISGLSEDSVTFNANDENADGYLAGQYDGWSEYWVVVPFENVTMQNGESLLIMETAGEMLGQSGLRMTLAEIAEIVTNFNCGVYFTPEFLAANPDLKVTLELRVFAEKDKHGFDYVIPVATNEFENNYSAPVASVNGVKYATLAEAFAAAKAGDTIVILKDCAESVLVVPAGVTLNLNGKYIEVDYAVVAFGDIVDNDKDNVDGLGGIKISNDTKEARTSLLANNKYLPIYDAVNGCYRFYAYAISLLKNESTESNKVTFKYRLRLSSVEAYRLLADTANSGVEFYINVSWTGMNESIHNIQYVATGDFIQKYASAAYQQVVDGEKTAMTMNKTFEITLKGLDALDSGTVISATPTFISATTGVIAERNEKVDKYTSYTYIASVVEGQ